MPRADWSVVSNGDFYIPQSKDEQQKIASFLSAIDTKIDQLTRKKELIEQYKKGVMQKIFSQELRFKADDGSEFSEWEEKKLGDIFERITRKNRENNQNILTISAQQGLVNQEEYFSKSVSAKDVSNYYLLHRGDFAYNKSYSNGYPMGAIKRLNKYDKGVVSTLYICFQIKSNANADFYEQYFNGGFLNREIGKIAQEGARNHGLLNVSVVEFFENIYFYQPSSIEEQTKIANFLTAIDTEITLRQAQGERLKQFKKGLLQQMFV
jgi:type I restriction enzyme S subunit